MQAICWKNGDIIPAKEATISVFDHGLLYGDGVFEGIRFYHGKPFRLDAHLQRLEDSARAIALEIPYRRSELADAVNEVIAAFAAPAGYIRLIVTRGVGCLGINPEHCARPTVLIIADRLAMISEAIRRRGARVIVAATRKPSADSLDPRIKSLNYLNHIQARIEANHAGADEALLLNAQGHLAEGTADNVFLVKGDELLTPPVSDGALAGITRAAIIELARDAGIVVGIRSLGIYDLHTADACFLTGTGAELIPVASIDGRRLPQCPGAMFAVLNDAFHALIAHECGGGE